MTDHDAAPMLVGPRDAVIVGRDPDSRREFIVRPAYRPDPHSGSSFGSYATRVALWVFCSIAAAAIVLWSAIRISDFLLPRIWHG